MSYDQSTLCRTRRWVPDMGFLTTIQNITDVARLNAYLLNVSIGACIWKFDTHHVKMYCV